VEIWELSARDVARGVRTRAFSAVEAVESSLDRIERTNGAVNALVEVDGEAALARAHAADQRVRAGAEVGLLHGVPVTFKVNTNVEGRATTQGVAAYADHLASESDPQVTSLLRAGAIPVGRSNCPAFAIGWTSENDLHGQTLNPWHPGVTPGGSSGGAAAAVAVGMCSLAQGSDTAGSIRYPAGCCGVAGIRPTKGRVPGWAGPPDRDPPMAVQAFVVQGPLARRVDDLRIGLCAMEAPDPRDPSAIPPSGRAEPPAAPIKVAVVADTGGSGLEGKTNPEASAAVSAAAGWLVDAGYAVEEVELPALGEAARLWWKLALTELKFGLVDEVGRVGDAGARRFFDLMFEAYDREIGAVGFGEFVLGHHRQGGLRREVSSFMDAYPLVLTPTSGEPPFPHGDQLISVDRTAELMAYAWPGMSVPVLGLPALGLPATLAGGAPVGVQLIGRPFDEETVLSAAEVIEARSGIATPIDPMTQEQA
jgi:amidase